jgi:membrane protease YdiL (CAAX protease family)
MAMSGLKKNLVGEEFYVDHIAILLWVLSQLIMGYVYTWAAAMDESFVRMLMFIQFMGIVGIIPIMMLRLSRVTWVTAANLDGVLTGVMVGMIGIFVIQIISAMVVPNSQFVDTMALMPIIMLPVAVSEEFLYRGFLFVFVFKLMPPTMGSFGKYLIAGTMSSMIFAAGHAYVYGAFNFPAIASAFAAGMVFAFTYARSKLLTVPILIHFLNNFIITFMAVI